MELSRANVTTEHEERCREHSQTRDLATATEAVDNSANTTVTTSLENAAGWGEGLEQRRLTLRHPEGHAYAQQNPRRPESLTPRRPAGSARTGNQMG